MINDNENEAESEKQNTQIEYFINRPRPRHGREYTKYKSCLSIMMVIGVKQHLSNISSSIQDKIKQHCG